MGKHRLTLKRRRLLLLLLLVGSVLLPTRRARPQQIPSWKGQWGALARAHKAARLINPTAQQTLPLALDLCGVWRPSSWP